MLKKWWTWLSEEKTDSEGGGSGGTESEDGNKQTPPPGAPEAEEGGDNLDEHGYEKPKGAPAAEGGGEKPAGGEADEEQPAPEKVEPVSGYGKRPEVDKDESKPGDPPVATPPAAGDGKTNNELGFELNVEGLHADDVKEYVELLKENAIPKEKAQAFVDRKKAQFKAIVDARKLAAETQAKEFRNTQIKKRQDWFDDLARDPKFGGTNFEANRGLVDRLLAEMMPETKKVLTGKDVMLPPYIMKDLAPIAERLFASGGLVNGQPPTPAAKEKGKEPQNDYDAFYNGEADAE